MPKHGRKFRQAADGFSRDAEVSLGDAVAKVKAASFAKFDETVDVSVNLGVQPKYADQMVRGSCTLPHGTGRQVRVLVFARGDKVAEAREAGADYVGGDDLVKKIQEGWLEFDACIATPDMMGRVGRIGRILGPRRLMPNPKSGTVTFDVATAIRATKAGKIQFRVDKAGIIHAPVGKVSFSADALQENITALIAELTRLKPSTSKGIYLKRLTVSSTMGPGVRVDVNELARAVR